jgi:hypothetical protein
MTLTGGLLAGLKAPGADGVECLLVDAHAERAGDSQVVRHAVGLDLQPDRRRAFDTSHGAPSSYSGSRCAQTLADGDAEDPVDPGDDARVRRIDEPRLDALLLADADAGRSRECRRLG